MNSMRLTLVTPPAVEPVTSQEVRAHLKSDDTTDNGLLATYIAAARELVEKHINRAIILQEWRGFLDCWPLGETPFVEGYSVGPAFPNVARAIELPVGNLISITHVKTYDTADVATTYSAANYYADTSGPYGRLVLRDGAPTPPYTRTANGIEIQFKAGYSDKPANVPARVRLGIMQAAAYFYENRGDGVSMLPAQALSTIGYERPRRV